MIETLTLEYISEVKSNLMSFPQEESLFLQNSPPNSLQLDSFINLSLKNDELFLEEIGKENQYRYLENDRKKIKLESENKIINKRNSHSGSNTPSKCFNTPQIFFKTSKILFNCSRKKLSGRKRKISTKDKNIKKIHNKYYEDNITRKIQVHVMNSLTQYVNDILSKIDLGLEHIPVFNKIAYSFKQKISTTTFEENKKKTIENLIGTEISPKYKTIQSDYNIKELEKIKKNEVIKNILSQKYVDYIREIYYKNERTIDLSKYGLKKIIRLSNKVKLYEDIFKGKLQMRIIEIEQKK